MRSVYVGLHSIFMALLLHDSPSALDKNPAAFVLALVLGTLILSLYGHVRFQEGYKTLRRESVKKL